MAAFANLTEDERERLEMLIEEASEIVKAGTKILRHGYQSYHPNEPNITNRDLLGNEIDDLLTILDRMNHMGDIEVIDLDYNAQWKKKLKWTHHQSDKVWGARAAEPPTQG